MSPIMKPNKITIHCSDSPNGKEVDISEVARWHKEKGIDPVGYHGIIQPNGEWQDGRPLNSVGAHVKDHNTGNIGICLIGRDKFTKEQFDKLFDRIKTLRQCFDIEPSEIYTHNQFDTAIAQGKTCPNMTINRLLYFLSTEDYKPIKQYFWSES